MRNVLHTALWHPNTALVQGGDGGNEMVSGGMGAVVTRAAAHNHASSSPPPYHHTGAFMGKAKPGCQDANVIIKC